MRVSTLISDMVVALGSKDKVVCFVSSFEGWPIMNWLVKVSKKCRNLCYFIGCD